MEQKSLGSRIAPRRGTGLLARIASVLVAGIVLAVALTVSVLLFALLLAGGLILLGYFLWKTRALRARIRGVPPGRGRIIEGEASPDTDPAERR